MKKSIIILNLVIFCSICCTAQKAYNSIFAGTNLTATGLSFANSEGQTYQSFKDPKVGFNVGYKYVKPVSRLFSFSAGAEFIHFSSQFKRSIVTANPPTGVIFPAGTENIKMSRLWIPLQGYLNFVNVKKYKLYATLGANIILVNSANRTVDYYIYTPPSTFTKNTYTGTQGLKFGESNGAIGAAFTSGLGSEFEIEDRNFTVELLWCSDISKNKVMTLHNIESDSYFFTKFKSLKLTVGTSFSFHHKK